MQGQDAAARELAQRRSVHAADALERYANLKDRPAVPELNPSVPPQALEGLGGGPPVPTNYQAPPPDVQPLPTMPPGSGEEAPPPNLVAVCGTYEHVAAQPMIPATGERLKAISQLAQGGPVYAKAAERLLSHTLEGPKEQNRFMATPTGVLDISDPNNPKFVQNPEVVKKLQSEADKRVADAESAQQKAQAALSQAQTAGQLAEAKVTLIAAQTKLDQARTEASVARGAAGPAKPHTTDVGYDVETGRPIVRDQSGTRYRIGEDGVPETTPFKGELIPAAAKEAEVKQAMEVREHLTNVNSLLQQAKDNTGAFGSKGALLGLIPGPAGAWLSAANLTDKQRQSRSEFSAQGAAITHDLYGSAFSGGEQERAKPFLVQPSDYRNW